MPLQFVPFTSFSPSQEFGGDLLRCENVIPALGGLRSVPKLNDSSASTSDRLLSSYIHHYPTSATYTGDDATEFHASRSKVYTYSGAFTDRTGALVFGGASSGIRRWASFGNDIIGVNASDAPIRRVNNAGNFVALGASTFIPNGRLVGVVREFMIHAALSNVGRFQDEFAWSDVNDATWYDDKTGTRPASVAGSKRIVSSPGQIMAFVGGEYGIFLKRNSMHVLNFTGGSDIFRLDTISPSVGTPLPSSPIRCRDGVLRFWGGDGFYAQSGQSEPVLIASGDGVTAILLDNDSYQGQVALDRFNYDDREEEDMTMFAAEDPEMGGVFWFYRCPRDFTDRGNSRWVHYNYKLDTWALGDVPSANFTSAVANRNFISTQVEIPRFIYGTRWDALNSKSLRWNFQTGFYAITLATQRFSIAKDGAAGQGQRVRINAIQPAVTMAQSTLDPDYKLASLPQDMQWRLVAANDPHFQEQLDANNDQVSPRYVTTTMADANGYGWLGMNGIEGRSFILEVKQPESATGIRHLRGAWVDYTEV